MSIGFAAYVRFRLPDGREQRVAAGSLIGRSSRAELCLKYPDVSEAHAFVSMRGGSLFLLALRRRVILDDCAMQEIKLEIGQRLVFSRNVTLEVLDLQLPDHVYRLTGDAGEDFELVESVYSIELHGREILISPEYRPDARVWIWSDSEGLLLQLGAGKPRQLHFDHKTPRHVFELGDRQLAIETTKGVSATAGFVMIHPPMRIHIRTESVYIEAKHCPPVIISGKTAAPIIQLAKRARSKKPVEWHVVAEEIWPKETDVNALRRKWDRHTSEARTILRNEGLRPDLVYPDGCGNVELKLHPGDELVTEED